MTYDAVEVLSLLSQWTNTNSTGNEATTVFGIPELDALLPSSSPIVLELTSPPPTHHPSGAGKTSLLHLIIAHAVLPSTCNLIPDLNGHDAAIILFDPLHHFSVARLASVILTHLTSKLNTPLTTLSPSLQADLINLTTRSLDHVHIFRPQSWPSLLSTLDALPTYLFDNTQHKSTHRRIHSLILEDTDTFIPSLRAAHPHTPTTTTNPLAASSKALTTHLSSLSTLLHCNTILTAPSIAAGTFRSALPTSWPAGSRVTRLAVRRVDVVKFAPEMGVEQAEGEAAQRWEVVRRARFECWRVGEGEGFVFRVGEGGVEVE